MVVSKERRKEGKKERRKEGRKEGRNRPWTYVRQIFGICPVGLKETRKNFSQNSRCFWPRISSEICQQPYRLRQLPGTQYVHPSAQTFSSLLDFRQFLDHKCSIHLKAVCWVFYCQNFIYGFSKPHLDLDRRTQLLRYIIHLLLRDCLKFLSVHILRYMIHKAFTLS